MRIAERKHKISDDGLWSRRSESLFITGLIKRGLSFMSINEATNHDEGAVRFEREGAIAMLTLARPQALNALTWEMYKQIENHLDSLLADETLRVLILRGEGKAFAAGTDIAQFQGFTGEDGRLYEQKMERIVAKLEHFPRPV